MLDWIIPNVPWGVLIVFDQITSANVTPTEF